MPDSPTPLTRRGLLAGGLGGLALAASGCDAIDGVLGGEEAEQPGAVTPTAPAADADGVLVEEVAAAIAAAAALAAATAAAVPSLAPLVRPLERVHAAHAAELGWSGTADAPDVRPAKGPALRRVLRTEAALQDRLVAAVQDAQSGAVAQVLASMAAAVAQQRAVLG